MIVNLFGVPGAGKSTCAAYIFAQLKMRNVNCELVTEYAKDMVWAEASQPFRNQGHMFGEQSYRISRCYDKVDVIITDSPLPLTIMYNNDRKRFTDNFDKMVMDVFNSYQNLNYVLMRTHPYSEIGRFQTEEESDALQEPIYKLLRGNGIPYKEIPATEDGYTVILTDILDALRY